MNGTRAVAVLLIAGSAGLMSCSEREPASTHQAEQQAPERASSTPAAPDETPQTPREARRERGQTGSPPPGGQSSDAGAAPDRTFVVPVDMQSPLTIRRSGADDIGVRTIGVANGVAYYVPQAWTLDQPSNTMRLAQLQLPAGEGSELEPGVLVISGGIGGSVYDNLNRWLAQMPGTLFTPQVQVIDFGERDPLLITQVIMYGTLRGGTPGGPSEDLQDTGFFGAIVEGGPEGTVFVKATGPREVMERHRKIWDYFVRTLRAMPARPEAPDAPGR